MPKVGQGNEAVSFPYDAEGIKAAEKYAQATGQQVDYTEQASEAPGMRSNISLGYAEGGKVPMSDGAQRSVTTHAGGGKTGYNIVDKYETGGRAVRAKKKKAGKQQKSKFDKVKEILAKMENYGKEEKPKRPKPLPYKPGDKPKRPKPMPDKPTKLLKKKK
tara:strand:+ start:525 stop:1007 length:483 start_codon:yes stop_codon:yes gene_type:complete